MTYNLDQTHDIRLRSWVPGANGHPDFPLQNLPLGMFSRNGAQPRPGVAIGHKILDLGALLSANLLHRAAAEAVECIGTALNPLLALGADPRRALRTQLSRLLAEDQSEQGRIEPFLYAASACQLHLPAAIGDYTDFYVGIHHAQNIGCMFRPDNPLPANYKFVPIGYHGRASSVHPSGTPINRPFGQIKTPEMKAPIFGPTQRLDFELELAAWIGTGNKSGEPIPIAEASDHIAGFGLLNDWSARDVQVWEYQPLGPFLAKNFATTVSPWIITPEALAPFRTAQSERPDGDPQPLPYLFDEDDQRQGAFDIGLNVFISTERLRNNGLSPHRISTSNARHMYWTFAQIVAHHTCNGCNLRSGDLLGTGTISGSDIDSCGSLVEATRGGQQPIQLPSGEERRFLEDGDEIIFTARGNRDGYASIGFGECRARTIKLE